jgi:hypothetical protein
LLFAFFLIARKSNLVPTNLCELDNHRFLLRKDVVDCGSFLLVKMRWSKTIQTGERVLEIPLHSIDKSLFLLKSRKPVTYSLFMKKLKFCINVIGLDSDSFSTHSFRRGFATNAFRLNLPADLIQLMGDWKADAYKNILNIFFKIS